MPPVVYRAHHYNEIEYIHNPKNLNSLKQVCLSVHPDFSFPRQPTEMPIGANARLVTALTLSYRNATGRQIRSTVTAI